MDLWAIIAGLLALIVAVPASFVFGRKSGREGELAHQREAKSTADDLSKRIVSDAEREADWVVFDGAPGPFHDSVRTRVSLVSTGTLGSAAGSRRPSPRTTRLPRSKRPQRRPACEFTPS